MELRSLTPFAGFDDFSGRVWLNTAHQGALPLEAAEAARAEIQRKLDPTQLPSELFDTVPERLRAALARVLNVPADEVILTNSASYGLHLLARHAPLGEGDEVLVADGDFPSDILPWLLAERQRGICVTRVKPSNFVVSPEELNAAITARTRLYCTTWVNSLNGYAIDLEAIGRVCRDHGILFIVNGSQGLGARPIDLGELPVDAFVSVGFKWLCGPYGTGVLWMAPELRRSLKRPKAYWLTSLSADDLAQPRIPAALTEDHRAQVFDIFGTANFFNASALSASVEHLLSFGFGRIAQHDQELVDLFVENLDRRRFDLQSPERGPQRSTLVFFSHRDAERNANLHRKLQERGIYLAMRAGSLRMSPHLYNGALDIDRLLEALRSEA